jgi:hypothetical protein
VTGLSSSTGKLILPERYPRVNQNCVTIEGAALFWKSSPCNRGAISSYLINRGSMFDLPDSDILPLSMEHSFWTWSAQGKVEPIP